MPQFRFRVNGNRNITSGDPLAPTASNLGRMQVEGLRENGRTSDEVGSRRAMLGGGSGAVAEAISGGHSPRNRNWSRVSLLSPELCPALAGHGRATNRAPSPRRVSTHP